VSGLKGEIGAIDPNDFARPQAQAAELEGAGAGDTAFYAN